MTLILLLHTLNNNTMHSERVFNYLLTTRYPFHREIQILDHEGLSLWIDHYYYTPYSVYYTLSSSS